MKEPDQSTSLPISNGRGQAIGSLVPITAQLAQDRDVLSDLCRWRAANMTSFFTVFEPSVEKTQAYLLRLSLPDPGRILFLIQDAAGRRVGNIGLCNVTDEDAELDNVLRGESVGDRSFMRFVQWSLADWVFHTLGLQKIYLNVLADNERAIRSYEHAGFAIVERKPLTRIEIPGGYNLVPATGGEAEDGALALMELDRARLQRSRASSS